MKALTVSFSFLCSAHFKGHPESDVWCGQQVREDHSTHAHTCNTNSWPEWASINIPSSPTPFFPTLSSPSFPSSPLPLPFLPPLPLLPPLLSLFLSSLLFSLLSPLPLLPPLSTETKPHRQANSATKISFGFYSQKKTRTHTGGELAWSKMGNVDCTNFHNT